MVYGPKISLLLFLISKQLRLPHFRKAAAEFAAWTNQFGASSSLTAVLAE
jgi:hypothetical protein